MAPSARSSLCLNTSQDGDSTTSPGKAFQYFIILSVKNFFIIFKLYLSWCSLRMIKDKDCDGHGAVILHPYEGGNLLGNLISAGILSVQKRFCFSISACQYGMCSSMDEGELTAQTSFCFLLVHTPFLFLCTDINYTKYFLLRKIIQIKKIRVGEG